ncbi:L-glutamate gamma-semialdehyde dehydrogenase [Salvia divinorum]|uniref:L-glutamate gamma-semialdehyde dehydrogenase n=1 Tax=Salvia divinorum TaxID=28513 RepID=A0ABD1HEE7_SALDI
MDLDNIAIITPFNFPVEIPLLQLMGNKPLLKVDSKVAIVMEQMLCLLHDCGLPLEDVDFINYYEQSSHKPRSINIYKKFNMNYVAWVCDQEKLEDLTIALVLTVTTEVMLEINGSKLVFGGVALQNHSPLIKPSTVFIPFEEILKEDNYDLVTKKSLARIGTLEAIKLVWSCHRDVIYNNVPVPQPT